MADTIVVQNTQNLVNVTAPGPQGIVPYLPMVAGQYYRPQGNYGSIALQTVNYLFLSPIFVPTPTSFDRIGLRTNATAYSGTAVARVGIYGTTAGRPGPLVSDLGTISTSAASTSYELTIAQTLQPGFYWLAFVTQTQATTGGWQGTVAAAAQMNFQNLPVFPQATNTASAIAGYYYTGVTGALPAALTAASLVYSVNAVTPYLRAA